VLQAVDNLLRRTPGAVLPRDKMMAVLLPFQEAEDDWRRRDIGHGGGLEKTFRYPDAEVVPMRVASR